MIDSKRCPRCERFCAPKSFRLIEDENGVRLAELCTRCERQLSLRVARRAEKQPRRVRGLRESWLQRDLDKLLVRLAGFGLTLDAYSTMLADQGGACAICDFVPPAGAHLIVDHDHRCCHGNRSCGRCVRGLICGNCNTGLGLLGDDLDTVEKAASYLRRYRLRRQQETGS